MYTDHERVVAIVHRAFPDFTPPKGDLQLIPFKPIMPTSHWAGGFKDEWAIVSIAGQIEGRTIPDNGSHHTGSTDKLEYLDRGFALVRVTGGATKSAAVYLNETEMSGLMHLRNRQKLTELQTAVLLVTKSLISSARLKELQRWGISKPQYEEAAVELEALGLLKRKAITVDGRNEAAMYRPLDEFMIDWRRRQKEEGAA